MLAMVNSLIALAVYKVYGIVKAEEARQAAKQS
jgi:hypothetical protein